MKVLVTGSDGFIAKNLIFRLREIPDIEILKNTKLSSKDDLEKNISNCDYIVHLAGVNRPLHDNEFDDVNSGFTKTICELSSKAQNKPAILFASSTQAELDNEYGQSKARAEEHLVHYAKKYEASIFIYRLPSVMGKWCRPNYNSVVATFCNNIANNLPISINDPKTVITLVYIDDVVDEFIRVLTTKQGYKSENHYYSVSPVYKVSLGQLSDYLYNFRDNRKTLFIEEVGSGFLRALYSTYISYYSENNFSYEVPVSTDERGAFVEMLKTKNSGQISFFTCHPGLTRGSHYHHTKTEKFMVVQGNAIFRFRNLVDDRIHQIDSSSQHPRIVESIPGWIHDITNNGNEELIVMIWANEIYNQIKPDTIQANVMKE